MNRSKRLRLLVIIVCLILTLTGCQNISNLARSRFGNNTDKSGSGYNIYYLSQNGSSISGVAYQLTSTTERDIIAECMDAMATMPENTGYSAVLTGPAAVEKYSYNKDNKTLSVYFNESFYTLEEDTQLLTRAAVVKTMTQFRNIVDYVTIKIGEDWLRDAEGNVLRMDRDDFVSEITNDLDQLEDARIILYFANKDLEYLSVSETNQRYYNYGKDSLASIVIDALLRGPVTDQYRPSFSSSTQVRSLHTSDGLCTVDFNQAFLKPVDKMPYELTVYSLVNTLCELPGINQVQITVDGEVVKAAPEDVDISGPLTARPELVK